VLGALGGIGKFVSGLPVIGSLPGAGLLGGASDVLRGLSRSTLPQGITPRGPGGILSAFPGVPGGVTGFADPATGLDVTACPPRGFHLNKSSYFLRDGTFVERGTVWVRNRRRNASNGRANDHAIRRLSGAQNQAKEVLRATGWRTISKRSARELRNAGKKVCN